MKSSEGVVILSWQPMTMNKNKIMKQCRLDGHEDFVRIYDISLDTA